jgi:single-strand DNA-binding protein
MSDLNKSILTGRLTKDPELKEIPGDKKLCLFSIACNMKYKDNDLSNYFDCEAWNKAGEIINAYVKKGDLVAIDGRLKQDRWTDEQGNKRSKIVVIVEHFRLMSSKKEDAF